MFKGFLYSGSALLFFALTMGCSHSPLLDANATCQSTDWYEKGRQNGATGEKSKKADHEAACGKSFDADAQALYMNGFHSGLTDYCSEENAFNIGQMGGPVENHCPKMMKESFTAGHKKGVQSRLLRNKNQEIARKIETLSREVDRKISSVDQNSLSSELEDLKRQYAQNQKKISRMRN